MLVNVGKLMGRKKGSSGGGTPLLLPWVGPFQTLSRPNANTLPNITYSSNTVLSGAGTADNNPIKAKNITIAPGVTITSTTYSVFMWADTITFGLNSRINAIGSDGQSADVCTNTGGNGGSGASGGGGGCVDLIGIPSTANGGDGDNGQNGQADDPGGFGGAGGSGFGQASVSHYPSLTYSNGTSTSFTYDVGGDAGQGPPTGPWGRGGYATTNCIGCPPIIGNGGGGGGGVIVLVCRHLVGVQVNQCGVESNGGGNGGGGCSPTSTNGAPGNLYLAAQIYQGDDVGAFGFSTLKMLEVASNGTTVLAVHAGTTGDSWSHP